MGQHSYDCSYFRRNLQNVPDEIKNKVTGSRIRGGGGGIDPGVKQNCHDRGGGTLSKLP